MSLSSSSISHYAIQLHAILKQQITEEEVRLFTRLPVLMNSLSFKAQKLQAFNLSLGNIIELPFIIAQQKKP
jgi:hypothetical protein